MAAAGSTVNGTSARFKYTATAGSNYFYWINDNSETLAYRCSIYRCLFKWCSTCKWTSDCTVTSGSSIVLTSGASASDVLEVVAFGTFELSNIQANDLTDVYNWWCS